MINQNQGDDVATQFFVATNGAPSGTDVTRNLLEDGVYTFTADDFGFSDTDGNTFTAVRFTTLPDAGVIYYDADGEGSGAAVQVAAGQAYSVSAINSGKLTYRPAASANGDDYASFTFQVQDNGGTPLDPDANIFTFDVTPVNDAPSGIDGSQTIVQGATFYFSAATFPFTDLENNSLYQVCITTLPNVSAGTLYFGGDPVFAGQFIHVNLITDLYFVAASSATGTTSFTFQIQDNAFNSNGGSDLDPSANTFTLNLTAPPPPPPPPPAGTPVVDLNGAAEGSGVVLNVLENDSNAGVSFIAPAATVTDPTAGGFAGGVLEIEFTANGDGGDLLTIVSEDFLPGAVRAEDGFIYIGFAFSPIATYAGGENSDTPLLITFASGATAADVAAVLRRIGYQTTSDAPSEAPRTITYSLSDGRGGNSVPVTATVNVTAQDDPTIPTEDYADPIAENQSITIDVLANDTQDPDGVEQPPQVIRIDGQDIATGETVTIASGATVTLGEDGRLTYDPNGAFDSLTSSSGEQQGAVNTSATDLFIYEITGGGSSYVVLSLTGVAGAGDTLGGDWDVNVITGTTGFDFFNFSQGGDDQGFGLGGTDYFYFGAEMDATDQVDGGADAGIRDSLILQGDYSQDFGDNSLTFGDTTLINMEYLSLQSGSISKWGDLSNGLYSYDITFVDANVAEGQRFVVNAQSLMAGENFTFDGSDEKDGTFLVYAGHGVDILTGGTGEDVFYFEGIRWGADDRVIGGDGMDTLVIRGDAGLNTISFGAAQLDGIEALSVNDRFATDRSLRPSYALTLDNGNVGAGKTLSINGSSLLDTSQTISVDGSDVHDGRLNLYGGAGNDVMIGGDKNDLIYTAGGQDNMTGGLGSDTFQFRSVTDSTSAGPDMILDFVSGTDQIDLQYIDAIGGTMLNDPFTFSNDGIFHSVKGELRAYDSGSGYWVVEGDVDGNGGADFAIRVVTADAAPLVSTDFIW